MKPTFLQAIAVLLIALTISIPVCFAEQLDLSYDENGNLITGDGKYREDNSFNQLSKIYNGSDTSGALLEEFAYHPTEERILVKKTYESGALKDTTYYFSKEFVRVINSSGTYDYTYVYHEGQFDEGQFVAELKPDGSKYFINTDYLGSSTVVTDEAGIVVENTSYL